MAAAALMGAIGFSSAAATQKPVLHARHWIGITGKPQGATAAAAMFQKGGNAIDAACAMLAVVCTMHDDVGWGGETQALIYHPETGEVIGINGLGVAPTGATPEFFREKGLRYPPGEGPLAALTPGNPGSLMVMLAEFGTLSLREVLEPAMQMAEGYPIEHELVRRIEASKEKLKAWPDSRRLFLKSVGGQLVAPRPGEIFRQPDLLRTLQQLVEAESVALKEGRSRRQAIMAAYDRFYRGDIAKEFVRGSRALGGLHTEEDLANWRVRIETPVRTTYRGVEVCKLAPWTQGPVMLQVLNLLEPLDLKSMGHNSARYIHAVYQAMNLAFADRDFYYGDPYVPPVEPIVGLLSKEYAQRRAAEIDWNRNRPDIRPGDPYPFEGRSNPFRRLLQRWSNVTNENAQLRRSQAAIDRDFHAGTTSIQAADKDGWVISVTASGGWLPACIAGRTGIGMSQRMQSFVLDEAENPFNVVAPGKQPRVTLTPTIALKKGKPFLCFSVQGGDTQDQNLLQFFLNVVEFGMTVQEACEAPNFTSYQMRSSFGQHEAQPGRLTLNVDTPAWVRRELGDMGYTLDYAERTSGPITAIYFDREHNSFWGGASNDGEDYGVAW
jgi:gamma-glutamyltranspeptidase/glutathione hydrolase